MKSANSRHVTGGLLVLTRKASTPFAEDSDRHLDNAKRATPFGCRRAARVTAAQSVTLRSAGHLSRHASSVQSANRCHLASPARGCRDPDARVRADVSPPLT